MMTCSSENESLNAMWPLPLSDCRSSFQPRKRQINDIPRSTVKALPRGGSRFDVEAGRPDSFDR